MRAAAAVLEIPIRSAEVSAEGDVDLRGTLGIAEDVPVGFKAIRLRFDLVTDAAQENIDQLLERILELKPRTLRGHEVLRELNLDSLGIVILIKEIDDATGVTISPGQFAQCERIDDLAVLVHKEKGSRSAAA